MALPGSIINVIFRKYINPIEMSEALTIFSKELASCGVVIALAISAVGYFAAVLPFVLGTLYFIQKFYLQTSRQLRLLE